MHGGCPYDGPYPPGCPPPPPPPPGPPCPPGPGAGAPLDGCPQMPPDALPPPDGVMLTPPEQGTFTSYYTYIGLYRSCPCMIYSSLIAKVLSPPTSDPRDEYLMFDTEAQAAGAGAAPPPLPPMDPATAASAAAATARYTITNLDASSGGGSSDGANSS